MASITDLSDLINRATGGNSGTPQNVFWFKSARIQGALTSALIAGRPASLWRYDGHPGAGAIPGVVEVPTNATPGALPFTSPGGGRESWMVQAWATGLVGGTLLLYDRLLHIGGLSGITTSHAIGGTLTRNTTGQGNFAMAEIYTALGTLTATITMSYTNQAGTDTRTSTAVQIGATGFREITRAILLPLQATDTGIRAVASATLSSSTGVAGSWGLTVCRPLAYLGIGAGGATGWRDFVTGLPGMPKIDTGACLSLLWFPQTTTVPELFGGYSIVEA